MAGIDGMGAASTGLKAAGGLASMIPGYGTAIGAGLSAIGGILDMADAAKQKEEAEKIQKKAEQVKKQPLEKEYLQALRGKKMLALSGLPEIDQAKESIDLGAANALKSIKEASPYGGSVVDAINAVINKGSQQKAQLDAQQAQAKLGLQKDVLDTLWNVGGQQRELTKEQRTRQEALYSQAQDLMAAATANKQIGREKAIGAGIQGVGGLAKMLGNIDFSKYNTSTSAPSVEQPSDSQTVSEQEYQQPTIDNVGTAGLNGADLTQAQVADLQTQMNEMLAKGGNPYTIASIRKLLQQYSLQQ